MDKLKIALLQIAPETDLVKSRDKGTSACRKAKEMGADIALFPEMFSCGYRIYDRPVEVWKRDALSSGDDFVLHFGLLSKELGLAIGITYLEKFTSGPRNTLTLFDRHGKRVLDYAKVHTCDFGAERNLTPGKDFYVTDLDTEKGMVKVGAMICFDREFPESARILMLKGAEIVLVPNACPMEINQLSQLRGRAYENMMGIATCNYPAGVPDCNGHSSAFDGIAYLPELSGSRDSCILQASEAEGIYLAEFDLDLLRTYREKEVHGNAFRKVNSYGILLDNAINPPFCRKEFRT